METVSALCYIIILISDGCGYNQVDAASLYQYGQTGTQVYQQFPVQISMSTYADGGSYDPCYIWQAFDNVASGATDSAAAATAMSTGHKTYGGAIGVGPDEQPLRNIMEFAEEQGMMTGVVTSVMLSHATPAGFVAHSRSRGRYGHIAQEMLGDSAVDVIMGCGNPYYDDDGNEFDDPCRNYGFVGGEDFWNEVMAGTVGSDADGDGDNDPWTLVQSKCEFEQLAQTDNPPSRVLGIPMVVATLQHNRSGDRTADAYVVPLNDNVPSLATMTRGALNVLDESENGFVLMVEGGAVDWAGHSNYSGRLIEEEIDFNRAVEAVVQWVEANDAWDQTLVIVTADHECGYLTGPDSGQHEDGPQWNPLVNNGAGNQPGMEWHSGGHTNSLVPFYAKGAYAQEFLNRIDGEDPIRGRYIDNTDLPNLLFDVLQQPVMAQ
ncbi:MAG: alkaline phosphatase [Sedimentisphaerales bacterium]|nr:alkaline phosphatase [Sedimentisphaerales bacterium]